MLRRGRRHWQSTALKHYWKPVGHGAYKDARLAARCLEARQLLCAAALPGAVLAPVRRCLPPARGWPLIGRCHSPATHSSALNHPT